MNIKKIIASYMIIVGIGIIGLWIMLFATDQIPELETEPIAIAFHIFIEIAMGIISFIAGLSLLKNYKYQKELIIFANGMICYSVINSSGYYGDLKQYSMILMFFVILLFSLSCVFLIIKTNK
ncbi:MAG: hypothetical protein JXC31_02635 [Acholeplasmataceae bacterium]|nr:hypothetical protein [Acholeplasmataceae bacterium]